MLDWVVVDLDEAVFEIDLQHRPEGEHVVDGFAHDALQRMMAAELHSGKGAMDALNDHAALA